MKTILCLLLLSATTLSAQLFTPSNVGGAAAGAGIGAIIGHQSGQRDKGALIGGVAGYILGDSLGRYNESRNTRHMVPVPSYPQHSGVNRINSSLVGGVLGGVIGHQSDHMWEGAAIGAAAGYIFGDAMEERNYRQARAPRYSSYRQERNYVRYDRRERTRYVSDYYPRERKRATSHVVIINNYYGSPSGSANSLFGR